MANTTVNGRDLLDAVRKMSPEEFDVFLEEALLSRTQKKSSKLSTEETRLVKRINRGLPATLCRRYAQLTGRRKHDRLSPEQHQELLKLTHEAESRDAERAAALLELAKLRRLPVRVLMKQMGIEAPQIHG